MRVYMREYISPLFRFFFFLFLAHACTTHVPLNGGMDNVAWDRIALFILRARNRIFRYGTLACIQQRLQTLMLWPIL